MILKGCFDPTFEGIIHVSNKEEVAIKLYEGVSDIDFQFFLGTYNSVRQTHLLPVIEEAVIYNNKHLFSILKSNAIEFYNYIGSDVTVNLQERGVRYINAIIQEFHSEYKNKVPLLNLEFSKFNIQALDRLSNDTLMLKKVYNNGYKRYTRATRDFVFTDKDEDALANLYIYIKKYDIDINDYFKFQFNFVKSTFDEIATVAHCTSANARNRYKK
jgi:hypothetical protein